MLYEVLHITWLELMKRTAQPFTCNYATKCDIWIWLYSCYALRSTMLNCLVPTLCYREAMNLCSRFY